MRSRYIFALSVLALIVAASVAGLIFRTVGSIHDELDVHDHYDELLVKSETLVNLANRLNMDPSERARDQWWTVHSSMAEMIAFVLPREDDPEVKQKLTSLFEDNKKLEPLYARLDSLGPSVKDQDILAEQRKLFADVLLIKSRKLDEAIHKLVLDHNRDVLVGKFSSLAVMGVSLGVVAIVAAGGFVWSLRRRAENLALAKAYRLLRESEERFHRLVDNLPAIVYRYCSQGSGSYYSNHVQEVLGYSPEHLQNNGFLWHDSVHPDDLGSLDQALASAAMGRPFDLEYRVRTADGKWRWLHDKSLFLDEKDDSVVEGLAIDITERKELEEALRNKETLLTTIIGNSSNAVYVKNCQGRYVLVNPAMEAYVGKSYHKIIGRDDLSIFPEEEARAKMERDQRIMHGNCTETYEETFTLFNGSQATFQSTAGPLHDVNGELVGLFGISRNISDLKNVAVGSL